MLKLLFLATLIFPSLGFSQPQFCRQMFLDTSPSHTQAYDRVLEILKTISTDNQVLSATYGHTSLAFLLHSILHRQEQQLKMLKESPLEGIPQNIKDYYIEQLTLSLKHSRNTLNEMKENYDLEHISLHLLERSPQIFGPLVDRVNSYLFPSNAVLSELLVAINFNKVIHLESPLSTMMDSHWPRILNHLQKELSPEHLESAQVKLMDLHAIQNGVHYFVEVKYFGTQKDYGHASGKSVFTKLQHVKMAADQLPYPTQVTLAIVGPGRLEAPTQENYERHGIKVIYITPNW